MSTRRLAIAVLVAACPLTLGGCGAPWLADWKEIPPIEPVAAAPIGDRLVTETASAEP